MQTDRPPQQPVSAASASSNATTDATAASHARPAGGRWGRGQLPQANGSFWLLTVFTLVCAAGVMRPPLPLPTLYPVAAAACPVPVEVPGQGVTCLSGPAAQQLGLTAGDVWARGPQGERLIGPPARMAPRRLLAAQVRLDPETATAAELEALPDLGPQLAQRIVAERAARAARGSPPLRTRAALLQVSGLGKRRLQRLLPFLIPLP